MTKINEDCNSRRKFLDKGLKLGLLSVIGGAAVAKSLEEEEMVELMDTDGNIVKAPVSKIEEHSSIKGDHYDTREGFPDKKFVMVIDLARCNNSLECQKSCNKNHFIQGDNAWLKIYNMQDNPESSPYWMPTLCQHCDAPACVKVCPVDATFKRRDGIVLIDNERCIGCRFCMAACPYSVRIFNWDQPDQGEIKMNMVMEHGDVMDHNAPYTPDYAGNPSLKGTVDKCDFCAHRIDQEKLPHCVDACPNGVYFFGDLYEDSVTNGSETFQLSKLLKDKAGYRLMEDLGLNPSVYYLPPKNRQDGFEKGLERYNEFESVEKVKKS
ncbi:4Fe-4S dicluster domain-containing protein [Yeosuana sp.]|uniref:4Fe-4S dicluster domain-containing protein n=1 Tax=Yeosuana sp. TaxID=2529388 RepID=UPI004054CE63|tara:strand:- start:139 stop:1110 length:972 start_codon:yes stop_codon:yes gene_type:complete